MENTEVSKTMPDSPVNSLPPDVRYNFFGDKGITKREYFAAMAMQGIVNRLVELDSPTMFDAMARDAVTAADALINALNKQ